ncbi:multivesicular body subunit 12B-like [Asterias amurensis]|uniref:multivesicular body subunit 12B-like n=1 Tax=Asterias amurensis TaxID=7602 RepID=UPI003AB6FB5C
MADDSQPITGVCVVADKSQCPKCYEVIETTTDNQDADLWKDGFFRKVTRYVCFTRQLVQGNFVLADLTVIKDNDQIPQGYTSIATTSDTKEPVLKKKLLIAQFVARGSTTSALCNIFLTTSKAKTRSSEGSYRAEINGLILYLKTGPIPSQAVGPVQQNAQPSSNPQPYNSTPSYSYGSAGQQSTSPAQPLPYQYPPRGAKSGTLTRQPSMIQTNAATERIHSAIEGVPFEVHASLQDNNQSYDAPTLPFPSEQDVMFKYSYDFRTEYQIKQRVCASP